MVSATNWIFIRFVFETQWKNYKMNQIAMWIRTEHRRNVQNNQFCQMEIVSPQWDCFYSKAKCVQIVIDVVNIANEPRQKNQ